MLAIFLCLLALRQVLPTLRPAPASGRPAAANLSLKPTRNFLQEVRDRPEDFVANAGAEALISKTTIGCLIEDQPSPLEVDLFVPAAANESVHRRVAPSSSDDGDLFS